MFTQDILVLDTETTGLDISRHELIQLAALRLDKNTLAEVDRFVSYIKPSAWETQDPKAAEVHKISLETLADAPSIAEVLANFEKQFSPNEVLLSAYNLPFDSGFLYESYRRLGRRMPYDFHGVDIWAYAYYYWSNVPHTLNPNKRLGFGLSDVAALLGITPKGHYHDALADCEVEAEVLRVLLHKLPITK